MAKILITGGQGKFATVFRHEVTCMNPPKQELDVTNFIQLRDYIKHHTDISLIIHAGAITSVVGCERNKRQAYHVNVNGTRNVIRAIKDNNLYESGSKRNIKLVYISTPCVFDGKDGNYDEDSIPHPVNYYGLTKYISEELVKSSGLQHLIIRANFVPKEEWQYPKAFTDRYGTYLFTIDVVNGIKYELYNTEGIIHIVGEEKLSMLKLAKITTPKVKPLTLKEYYAKVKDVELTVNMTMITKRGHAREISRS